MLLSAKPKLICIASSTGGPQTLHTILQGVGKLNCAIVIVQHIQRYVVEMFCKSLNSITDMDVVIAGDNMPIEHGNIYIAPADSHTLIKADRLFLQDGDYVNRCKPSADVTMATIDVNCFRQVAAIVLTGMGHDGARGSAILKQRGATCIAQDPQTAIVYSMPQSAIDLCNVDRVLQPAQIRQAIVQFGR